MDRKVPVPKPCFCLYEVRTETMALCKLLTAVDGTTEWMQYLVACRAALRVGRPNSSLNDSHSVTGVLAEKSIRRMQNAAGLKSTNQSSRGDICLTCKTSRATTTQPTCPVSVPCAFLYIPRTRRQDGELARRCRRHGVDANDSPAGDAREHRRTHPFL